MTTGVCILMESEVNYMYSHLTCQRETPEQSQLPSLLQFSSFVLNSLHLKLHRHGWKCKSRYTESSPEGSMARNALPQLFYEVLPLGIDV